MHRPAVAPLLVLLASVLALAGCGAKGTQTKGIAATGTATLDGTPLEMGIVVLQPEGGGESASGQISKDGTFKVHDVKPGRYKAAVQTSMFAGMASQGQKAAAKAGEGRPVAVRPLDGTLRPVPAKYEKTTTSELTVEVRAGQPIAIDVVGK